MSWKSNKLLLWLEFASYYIKEVVLSNVTVAHDVLTPRHRMEPAMIKLDVGDLTERQLLAFANLITMTPGTLSLDVSSDRKYLLIHAMYAKNPETFAAELKSSLMERVRRVF